MLYLSLTGANPRLDEQGTQGVSVNTARIWTSMLHHRAYAQAAGRALTFSDFVTGEVWIPKEGASRFQVYKKYFTSVILMNNFMCILKQNFASLQGAE